MRRYSIVFTLLVILAGLVVSGCSQPEEPPIRLGTNIWPGYEPLYLAREIGVLPDKQVRLVEYPSASEVLRAFRNKNLEAASLTLDEALLLAQYDIPIRIILVHDISHGADVIMARPEITSVNQLRDKRVAVESGALGAFVLTRALEINGMGISDVRIRHLGIDAHEASYLNGEVDAAVTFEPVRTRLANAGAREVFSSREIPGEVVDVLVVHEDTYQQRLPALKALVDAWFESLDYLDRRQAQAADIIAKRLKISPEEVIASYDGLQLPSRADNLTLLDGTKGRLLGTLETLQRVLLQHNLMQRNVDTSRLPDSGALR
jgi:NitT/TauT family transport system substrate-binding protein